MESLNLYQRISKVMQEIEYLTKDDTVGKGQSAYRAITEEKVTTAVRCSMIKNGLVILPIEQTSTESFNEYEKESYGKIEKKQRLMSSVNVKYKIVNIDKPDEFEILASSGSGVDSQDKGIGKAMTYSYKYMLLRTFAIPTGEDPDKVSSQDLDEQNTVTKIKEDKPKEKSAAKKAADNLIELAKRKGFSEESLKKKYKKEVVYMSKAQKEEATKAFEKLPDKK